METLALATIDWTETEKKPKSQARLFFHENPSQVPFYKQPDNNDFN